MTELEDLMKAAMAAPVAKREEALRLLKGQLPKPEPYLTLRELSRALGFGVTTLRRWNIPGHDLGGFQRYQRGEVEAYLRSDDFKRRLAALRAERRISAKAAVWRLEPQNPKTKGNKWHYCNNQPDTATPSPNASATRSRLWAPSPPPSST